MTRQLAGLLALIALGTAGCASMTDGSPQSRSSVAESSHEPAPSVSDPSDSAGPPAEGSGGPTNVASINPCSLVSQAEAEEVATTRLQQPVRVAMSCTFTTPPTASPTAQLEIYIGEGAQTFYHTDKVTLGHKFRNVPGVGDQAFQEDGAIFFTVKGIWVGLHLLLLADTNTAPGLAKLAATVAGRI